MEVFRKASGVRISPHRDPDSAATLTVIFDREEEAAAYGDRRGVHRLYDNSKHVYTNWDPIMNRRTAHPRMNPWAWAHRDITYDATTCARTLDIMRRTCRVHLSGHWPAPVMKMVANLLFEPEASARPHFRYLPVTRPG